MTEEEKLAEEYISSLKLTRSPLSFFYEYVEEAFIAGLRAGKDIAETDLATIAYLQGAERYKPKWHKVADGDLPKIDKPCLVYLVNDAVITARLREDNVWTTNGCNAFENVIAWLEIPKYTEE